MVRLKSERWYSAEGQQRSKTRVAPQVAGSRRLISMCFLLGLVVLLMQKAADPRHVRNAFNALGVPLDGPSSESLDSQLEQRPAEGQPTAWEATCTDLIPRLLDDANHETIDHIALLWFAQPNAVGSEDVTATTIESKLTTKAEQVLTELAQRTQASETDVENQRQWLDQLEAFRQEWLNLWNVSAESPVAAERVSPELASALTTYLDNRLLASLQDATTWNKSETVAFWRLIQRGQGGAGQHATSAPFLNTLQLESEAEAYRGREVRFRGSVRRVERVNKNFAPLGIRGGYWLMWLRGDDNAVRPVAAYTTDPRAEQLADEIDEQSIDFPTIELQALCAKRLAYGSVAGVQVAPTLFVRTLTVMETPPPPFVAEDTAQLRSRLGWSLLAGGILAAAILLPIGYQFRRRSRPVRRQSTLGGWLLAFMVTAGGGGTAGNAWSQTPPWVKPDQQSAAELIVANLERSFDERSVSELRQYLSGASTAFPNLLLKTITSMRRLGWRQAFERAPIMASSGHVTLVPQHIQGWARLAMPVQLDDEQRSWFLAEGQTHLVRLEVQLSNTADDHRLMTVYCERVPEAWQTSATLRQPVQLDVLRIEDQQQPADTLCAICERVKWMLPSPLNPQELEPKLSPEYLRLGAAGWDLANFDIVLQHNQKSLSSDESTGFFSLMRIASQQPTSPQPASWDEPLNVLRDPQHSIGKQVHWRVRIVSATRVAVDDLRQQELLGSNSYIQYDGLVDIGSDQIRYQIGVDHAPTQVVDFQGEFPITIIGNSNTPFSPSEAIQQGQQSWRVDHFAELHGIFYRMWSYQSEMVHARNPAARQIAPLVMATQIRAATAPPTTESNPVGWFGWALCLAVIAILASILALAFGNKRRVRFDPSSRT